MKVKGFTLIELLAVIVILAIIALIAVPIILNIIDDSKESTVLVSGKNYIRALEQQILSKNIKEKFNPQVCIIQEDGNLMCDGDKPFIVEVSGSKPISGEIKFSNKKITEVTEMILDGYVLEMKLDKDLIVKGTTDILEPPLDPKGTYLMKGSSGNAASTFLGGSITKESVETITVTYTNKVPSNAIGSWDASAAQDGSIIAWYTDTDNNSLYELYIGGEGGVKANPTSSYLFAYLTNVITIDVSYLDTSDVTIMSSIFKMVSTSTGESTTKLEKIIGLNKWNTSKVTDMSEMFSYCSELTTIDVSSFDTSQVTNMRAMFKMGLNKNYGKVTEIIGLSNFNTSKVTNMGSIFSNCYNLKSIDLSSFNTSQVTSMQNMFDGCGQLTTIDLTKFDFISTNSNNALYMFDKCDSLTTIYVKDETSKEFISSLLPYLIKQKVTIEIV